MKEKKNHFYEWLILILVLIPSCFFIAKGINAFLFYAYSTPLYTNITRFDDIDITMQLPNTWGFETSEDGVLVTNQAYSESMLFTTVESAKDMETARNLFLLSLKDSYDMELDLKEGTLSGSQNNVFYVTYNVYTSFYISGVVESNGIYMNFVYRTNLTNDQISPITNMLKSVVFTKADDFLEDLPTENNKNDREGFVRQEENQ